MTPTTVTVPVKSAWSSKINIAQFVGLLASVGVVFGLDLDTETQAGIVVGIQGAIAAITWVLRTWFTRDIVAASI